MSDTTTLQIALLGNPNCGKTALFNLLTGSRQKVANYAGVTVERKEGLFTTPSGRHVRLLDLPGAYSLNALSADEAITRDVVTGERSDQARPDLLICVTDATNLRLNLRLVLEARQLNLPMVMALNMSDAAQHQGIVVDTTVLSRELGIPVVETIAIKHSGAQSLVDHIDSLTITSNTTTSNWQPSDVEGVLTTQQEVRRILGLAVTAPATDNSLDDRIDRVVLHQLWGMLILAATLFLMFQAVFSWAEVPMEAIDGAVGGLSEWVTAQMSAGLLQSLLADGIIAGVGGVMVFLPQILILFFFILALEDSGYLPRAAFLLDRIMSGVGLSGRSFIPLLSSFACAIPGIMATRTISDWRDRLVTIMIAPLMTCSARLPVYALLIAAFIPQQTIAGIFNLQGLVLFGLYTAGILSALAVAWVLKFMRGRATPTVLMMELPAYRRPSLRNLAVGLY
ncbi:MAG: ferrous iron transporter B, partial [Rhodocyclaceae bacterium]|nr:ferrous iron transporter B [Rhodocyclaceae bacterium]